MVFWGMVWFGVLGILFICSFDSLSGLFVYIIAGALSGLHLTSCIRAEFRKWMAESKTVLPEKIDVPTKQENIPSYHHPLAQAEQPIASASTAVELNPAAITNTAESNILPASVLFPKAQSSDAHLSELKAEPTFTEPNLFDKAIEGAKNWIMGGNTVVRVGVIVLFIGLAFLAKYTAQLGLFPIEARLSIVALFGLALLVFGFIKREKVAQYALTLQGAGIAVLYLTLLAAMKAYDLLPMTTTFVLMVLVCAFGCALAILQNSLTLALVSFAGGFAAPILLSTGEGNYIGLFTYYAILNMAILVIAAKKVWRPLNLLGFFSTFGVATVWGVLKYQPANYLPSQLFLFLFFTIYLVTAMFYVRNTARADTKRRVPLIDSTLIFGTPLVGFGLQVGLVHGFEYGAAFSALALAAIYVVCAFVLVRQTRGYNNVLLECFMALGVGFLTLAIPLALDGQWIAVAWALEGLGAFWVGMRQARWLPRALGLVLQGAAGLIMLGAMGAFFTPFLNANFLNLSILIVCAFIIAYVLRQKLQHSNSTWAVQYASLENKCATPFYLYGFVLALFAVCSQWLTTVPTDEATLGKMWIADPKLRTILLSSSFLLLSTASSLWGARINRAAHWPAFLNVFVMFLSLAGFIFSDAPLLSGYGWVFWPAALLLQFATLYRAEKHATMPQTFLHFNHAALVWLKTILIGQTLWWHLAHSDLADTSWSTVIRVVSLTLLLLVLTAWASNTSNTRFPLKTQRSAYLLTAVLPIALVLFVSALGIALASPAETRPLPYIPLLNPTDLSIALAFAALLFWQLKLKNNPEKLLISTTISEFNPLPALAVAGFIFINTIWLRVAHHFFGIEWNASALFDSYIVQTGYAILWTLMALIAMVWAHRHAKRVVWMIGAGLLGLTVAKLVFIDLANRNGFERIIAFIVVGVMMLIIGYLAPLPPETKQANESN